LGIIVNPARLSNRMNVKFPLPAFDENRLRFKLNPLPDKKADLQAESLLLGARRSRQKAVQRDSHKASLKTPALD
jgi:hypothetical protein